MISLAYRNKACVVLEPADRGYCTRVTLEDPVLSFLVFPELEHLDATIVVIQSVKMSAIGEFDFGTTPDLVSVKLSLDDIIWVNRVDLDHTHVSDHSIKATRVDGHRSDQVWQLLDYSERQGGRVSRVVPEHQSLVHGCSSQDRLLHACSHDVQLLLVEGDRQVRDLSELFILLLLNAHS